MGDTSIEWCRDPLTGMPGKTWNLVTDCDPISPGCRNCYARRMATRLRGRHGYPADEPFRVTLHPERLEEPLRWRKSRRVFVCSIGDLFHEDVPFTFIDAVFGVMALAYQHTFQILTKRPERIAQWLEHLADAKRGWWHGEIGYLVGRFIGGTGPKWELAELDGLPLRAWEAMRQHYFPSADPMKLGDTSCAAPWPLPNVWLGITAENQEILDLTARIGVNWCAIGSVKPDTARRFARHVLRVADRAKQTIAKAREAGWRIRNPET